MISGEEMLRGISYNKCPSWVYVGSCGSSDFDILTYVMGFIEKTPNSQNFSSIGQSVAEIWLF